MAQDPFNKSKTNSPYGLQEPATSYLVTKLSSKNKNALNYLISTDLFKGESLKNLKQSQYYNRISQDHKQLYQLLNDYFQYPIQKKYQNHLNANRLGQLDQMIQQQIEQKIRYQKQNNINNINNINNNNNNNEQILCECCSYRIQNKPLGICDFSKDIFTIHNLGPSTYLLFKIIKFLIYATISLTIVYCLFAIVTNKLASQQFQRYLFQIKTINDQNHIQQITYLRLNGFSLGSKIIHQTQENRTTTLLCCCLAFLAVLSWIPVYIHFKKQQNYYYFQKLSYEKENARISLFTLEFQNLPRDTTQLQLEIQLQKWANLSQIQSLDLKYYEKVKIYKNNEIAQYRWDSFIYNKFFQKQQMNNNHTNLKLWRKFIQYIQNLIGYKQNLKDLKFIYSMNRASIIFQMKDDNKQKKKLKEQANIIKENLVQQIKQICQKQQFKLTQQFKRLKQVYIYKRQQYFKQKRKIYIQNMVKNINKQKNINQQPFFVTFNHRKIVERILQKSRQNKFIFQYTLKNQDNNLNYNLDKQTKRQIKIRKAPQPKDIIWKNIGRTKFALYLSRIGIFIVVAGLFVVTFFILFSLSTIQKQDKKLLNFDGKIYLLLPIVVIGINVLIKYALFFLTKLERNVTNSDQQKSVAIKTILALIINTIFIPLLVNWFATRNIFGMRGLAQDVMSFAIINSLASPFFKILNIFYWLKRCIIFKLFKLNKFQKTQKKYNNQMLDRQRQNFQVGFQYSQTISIYLFTCFYTSLQPLIVFPALAYFVFIYFAKKIHLFHYCKRPIPCSNQIYQNMHILVAFGPIFFAIGNLLFPHLSDTHNRKNLWINVITLVFSILLFILLQIKAVTQYISAPKQQNLKYQDFLQVKKQIQQDYTLLNPVTSTMAKAIKFKKFQNKQFNQIYSPHRTLLTIFQHIKNDNTIQTIPHNNWQINQNNILNLKQFQQKQRQSFRNQSNQYYNEKYYNEKKQIFNDWIEYRKNFEDNLSDYSYYDNLQVNNKLKNQQNQSQAQSILEQNQNQVKQRLPLIN